MSIPRAPNFLFLLYLSYSFTLNCHCLTLDASLLPKENFIKLDESDLHDSPFHQLNKRNVQVFTGIEKLTSAIARLNDRHHQLFVQWTGNNSNVFICLARNHWDYLISDKPPVPSAVYISYDSGRSYKNKTNLFTSNSNNSFASIDKYFNHNNNPNYMVFIDTYNKMIFRSQDYGEEIDKVNVSFQPIDILFYPENPLIFLAYDTNKTLWITRDFGKTFSLVQEFVKSYSWADRWPGTWADTTTRALLVQRIEPSESTLLALEDIATSDKYKITIKMRDIEQFKKSDEYIFVTKKITSTHYDLYISNSGGDFYKAVFDAEHENNNFHVVDVTPTRIMVAVAHNETLSNLYISEVVPNNDYIFRLSLERLFCYFPSKTWKTSWLSDVTEETFADLHKVKGLRGVYLASQVTKSANSENLNPEHLQTLITFDWGSEWRPITPPSVNEIGQPVVNFNSSYSLHLTQRFMYLYPFAKTVPILTSESAPGLIVATGVLGTSLKGPTGVYVSRDAGLSWKKVLRDDYTFSFGDHGGIITAARMYKSSETKQLLYSTDQGESWNSFKFINDTIKVYNLMTEPGEKTTVFTLFGSEAKRHGWIIINVDLRKAFGYNCTDEDYKPWSPTGGPKGHKNKPVCIMGLKEVYERRIQHSNCYSGRDYTRPDRKEPCPCDIEDFECDYGFMKHVHSSGCIRNKSINYDPYKIPATCKPGWFYNRTKGYKKIGGDACYDGFDWQYLPESIPCPFNETSGFLLVALKKKILRFNIADTQPKPEVLPVRGLSNVIAIDFDMKGNCLFYADVERDIIAKQCLSGKEPPEILVESGLKSVEGLAYDWISKLLYFVDGTTIKIEAIRTDIRYANRMRITILNNKTLDKPRGIAVHPSAGYLYWTDWSKLKPHIGRSNLNGSDVQYLFNSSVVHWPNGITVDHIAEQIYWVDAKLDYIGAADLHGRHFRKIIKAENEKKLSHPFAVAVFKDLMYWDDWEQKTIFFSDKDHGAGVLTLTGTIEGLMDLKVFGHSIQSGSNACSNSSTVCSHLCFAQPNKLAPVCACPDDMIMELGECRCFDGSKPFSNHTCPKKNQCLSTEFQCASNSSCIPLTWKCNGENDCGDNSDEIGCSFQTCSADEYRCKNGYCIPKYWICDGDIDCAGGDDEVNCSMKVCTDGQFRCNDSFCISQRWHCDGEFDCKDHSDELNCTNAKPPVLNCTDKQFHCGGDPHLCIPQTWVCDGVPDCKDMTDESKCHIDSKDCDSAQFQCEKSKKCIYKAWQCDGDYDCGDGDTSDEANCPIKPHHPTESPTTFVPCKEFMFRCSDGKCIPDWWKCDNVPDCLDGADEYGCNKTDNISTTTIPPSSKTKCKANEFQCGGPGECIPSSWACDGNNDCTDASDEANCTKIVTCPFGFIKCLYSNSCYHSNNACNGHFDCPDHSDERDCANSASFEKIPHNSSCPLGFIRCPEGICLALMKQCNGHADCYGGFDENNCDKIEYVYQVKEIAVNIRELNSTSLPVSWAIDSPPKLKLEFLPSFTVAYGPQPQEWINHTKWLDTNSFTFGNLFPYTSYNVTVYVRIHGKSTVYPPSVFSVLTTGEDIPSAPWNVTVVQKTDEVVEVRWSPPAKPNGLIKQYKVYSTPPLPPMETPVLPQQSTIQHTLVSTNFQAGGQYSFWVTAENSVGTSNSSEVRKLTTQRANIGPVKNTSIDCVKNVICTMTWIKAEGASGYRIQILVNRPYPKMPSIILNDTTSYTFKNLAPGVSYKIAINAFHKTFEGLMSVVDLKTGGLELPVIRGIGLLPDKKPSGYTVSLAWKTPVSEYYKEKWIYGVYYGLNIDEVLNGAKNSTDDMSNTIQDLQACETYLFDVGIVGPLGVGPLSGNPVRYTTGFHRSAPPKGLNLKMDPANETLMIISWNSSCFEMDEPVGYRINIEDITKRQQASITLKPRNATSMQHRIVAPYGARYRVNMQTSEPDSIKTATIENWAPQLPTPDQVKVVFYADDNSYLIAWRLQWNLQAIPVHEFEILVCEGEEFVMDKAIKYKTYSSPYHLHELKPEVSYTVAVRLASVHGYYSSLSEINSIRLTALDASSLINGDSAVNVTSVFLLVSVGVFAVLLGLILGVYIFKHYRIRNSFTQFANSHYSTSSGAAIFTDRLDDEDSPVIRGFSDDEPLVVA